MAQRCLACGQQCVHTVSHDEVETPHTTAGTCKFVAAYQNEEYICRSCYRNGQRRVVAKVSSSYLGLTTGWSWHCPKCTVVFKQSSLYSLEREKLLETLQAEYVHVWQEQRDPDEAADRNMARRVFEGVKAASGAVVGAAPVQKATAAALGAVKEWTRPAYWATDEEITNCFACASSLHQPSSKHHCRRCGQGFCNRCSLGRHCVPEHGWLKPVRVCDTCLEVLTSEDEMTEAGACENRFNEEQTDEQPFNDDDDEEVCVITDASLSLPSEEQTFGLMPAGVWNSVESSVQVPCSPFLAFLFDYSFLLCIYINI